MKINAPVWIDLQAEIGKRLILRTTLDYAVRLLMLLSDTEDYEAVLRWGAYKALSTTEKYAYRVLEATEDYAVHYTIPQQNIRYHQLQTLPDEELLLVCAWAQYRAIGDYDLNAKVFSLDGTLKRQFLLGTGIGQVQTTASHIIWTSYYDQGFWMTVFQNQWVAPVSYNGIYTAKSSGNTRRFTDLKAFLIAMR